MAERHLVQWRRHLRTAVLVAEGIERLRPSASELRRSPLKLVALMMLVQNRRLAAATDKLVPENSLEAQLLQRTMFESWVNASWIRLREPSLRARRFIAFESVEAVRLFESCPEPARPPESARQIAAMKKWRRRFGRALRKPSGEWSKTWALTRSRGAVRSYGSLESRIVQVEKAMRRLSGQHVGREYWLYRVMSQPAHGSPMGLSRLFRWGAGQYQIKEQPCVNPLEPMVEASRYLIYHLAWAHNDLTKAFEAETRRLMDQQSRLDVPSFARGTRW